MQRLSHSKRLSACTLIMGVLLTTGALPTTSSSRADTRADGSFLNHLTNQYVTPHLDWARPLAGGSLKVLFVIPRIGAREVVELGQRLETDSQSVVTYNPQALAYDSVYEALVTGTSAQEKSAELAQKLTESYDAIVLANVDFKALSPKLQFQILEKVSQGAGLLLAYPRGISNPKMLSIPTDDWKKIGAMADVATLPGAAAKLSLEKILKTYRFGEGRIAALDYPVTSAALRGGLGLTAFGEYAPSGWKARYENNMVLVARALQWTAGRDVSPAVQPQWPSHLVAGERIVLPLQLQNTAGGIVHWRVRDEWNTVQASGSAPLQNGKTTAVEIPPLTAGVHFFDVRWEKDGKIASLGVFGFKIGSPLGGVTISTDKESYERGENVAVRVQLERPLQERAEVVARLEDLPGRKSWQRRLGVLPAGTQTVAMDFPNVYLPSIAGAIVIEIQRERKTLLKAEHVAFFPRREREIFPTLVWDIVPPFLTEMYAGQLLGNMNDPAGLTQPEGKGETGRLTALVNQRFAPYMTRIGLGAGPNGQTMNAFWLGMTKEESEQATKGEGSIYDSAVRDFWKQTIQRRITGLPRVGPMIYTLGDENHFSYDAGYSRADNIEWPKFLKTRYENIENLNREWGMEYARFEDVPHFTPQEMRDKRLFPAWYEHRRFMEKQYADVHDFLAQTIKEIDPHARVGAEGSEPGELEQTISKLDFWGPYSDAVGDELLRSIGQDKLRMLWWGYGPTAVSDGLPYRLWRPLLQGVVNGSALYNSAIETMGILSADLSFAEYFQKLRPNLARLDNGQAQTLIETPLQKDGIAILWSHASYSASFMDDRFFKPLDSMSVFQTFCHRQGLNFDFVTSKMAENGALDDYKVLCLFGASALSEKEAAAIQKFTARGGVVISDLNPGILSEYLRPLEKSRLADLFGTPSLDGIATLQLKPLRAEATVRGQRLSLAADKVFQSPQAPVLAARTVGKGEAILLNFNLGSAYNTAPQQNDFDRFLLDLLKLAGIGPEIKIDGLSPQRLVRVRQAGSSHIIGILADKKDIGKTWALQLPRAGWIYEVNQGFLGHTGTLQSKLDTPFKLLAVFEEKQSAPPLKLNRERATGGQEILLETTRLSAQGVYRVEVFSPSGALLKNYTKVFTTRKLGDANRIRFALSDERGRYRILLTDARTGLQTAREVELR